MPYPDKLEDQVRSPTTVYIIKDSFEPGNYTYPYKAKNRDNRIVFLKKYKQPAPKDPWFDSYVSYSKEIKRRVESD